MVYNIVISQFYTLVSAHQDKCLNTLQLFHPFPPTLPSGNYLFSIFKSLVFGLCLFPFVHLFCFLNSIYESNHMVFAFPWLILLSIIFSRSICVLQMAKFHSFLWPNNIPFYISVCVCVYTHHIFFYPFLY